MGVDRWVKQANGLILPRFAKGTQPYPCAECCGEAEPATCEECYDNSAIGFNCKLNGAANDDCEDCEEYFANSLYLPFWSACNLYDEFNDFPCSFGLVKTQMEFYIDDITHECCAWLICWIYHSSTLLEFHQFVVEDFEPLTDPLTLPFVHAESDDTTWLCRFAEGDTAVVTAVFP